MAKIHPDIIALGGVEISVTTRRGEPLPVKVRILEIEDYGRFIAVTLDEHPLAELVCGQPAGWARTLTPDSVEDIAAKALELNLATALRWMARRTGLIAKMEPMGLKPAPLAAPSPSAASAPASA